MNHYSNTSNLWSYILISTLLFILIIIAVYVVTSIFLGKMFKKADISPWMAWVPVLNNWKLLEMGDQKGFWILLAFIPYLGMISIIFMYIAMYKIGLKYNKEKWLILLAIFIPIAWFIVLGSDSAVWKDNTSASEKPASPPNYMPPVDHATNQTPTIINQTVENNQNSDTDTDNQID